MNTFQDEEALYTAIRNILLTAKEETQTAINRTMMYAYWQIGKLLAETNLDTTYLAAQLSAEFGKTFDIAELDKIRQFYSLFPEWNVPGEEEEVEETPQSETYNIEYRRQNELAPKCIQAYVRRHPKITAQELIRFWSSFLGPKNFIENESSYRARTDIHKDQVEKIQCLNGPVYVRKNIWHKGNEELFKQYLKELEERGIIFNIRKL